MSLFDSNSSKVTGKERGGDGTLRFMVGALTPRPPERPRRYIFLGLLTLQIEQSVTLIHIKVVICYDWSQVVITSL